MAHVKEPCPSCGTPTDVYIGQAIEFDDRLVWSQGVHCASCGYTVEADDLGLPPQHYREIILAQDGTWAVTVLDATNRSAVALTIKEVLALDRAEALGIARAIPGRIWAGSEAETEWLRRQLARRGVIATSEPINPGAS